MDSGSDAERANASNASSISTGGASGASAAESAAVAAAASRIEELNRTGVQSGPLLSAAAAAAPRARAHRSSQSALPLLTPSPGGRAPLPAADDTAGRDTRYLDPAALGAIGASQPQSSPAVEPPALSAGIERSAERRGALDVAAAGAGPTGERPVARRGKTRPPSLFASPSPLLTQEVAAAPAPTSAGGEAAGHAPDGAATAVRPLTSPSYAPPPLQHPARSPTSAVRNTESPLGTCSLHGVGGSATGSPQTAEPSTGTAAAAASLARGGSAIVTHVPVASGVSKESSPVSPQPSRTAPAPMAAAADAPAASGAASDGASASVLSLPPSLASPAGATAEEERLLGEARTALPVTSGQGPGISVPPMAAPPIPALSGDAARVAASGPPLPTSPPPLSVSGDGAAPSPSPAAAAAPARRVRKAPPFTLKPTTTTTTTATATSTTRPLSGPSAGLSPPVQSAAPHPLSLTALSPLPGGTLRRSIASGQGSSASGHRSAARLTQRPSKRHALVRLSHDHKALVAGAFRVSRGGCLTVRNFLLLNPRRIDDMGDDAGAGSGAAASPSGLLGGAATGMAGSLHSPAHIGQGFSAAHSPPGLGAGPLLRPGLVRPPTSLLTPASTNAPGASSGAGMAGNGNVFTSSHASHGMGNLLSGSAMFNSSGNLTEMAGPAGGGASSMGYPSLVPNPLGASQQPPPPQQPSLYHSTFANSSFTLQSTSINTPYSPITYSMDSAAFPQTFSGNVGASACRGRLLRAARDEATDGAGAAAGGGSGGGAAAGAGAVSAMTLGAAPAATSFSLQRAGCNANSSGYFGAAARQAPALSGPSGTADAGAGQHQPPLLLHANAPSRSAVAARQQSHISSRLRLLQSQAPLSVHGSDPAAGRGRDSPLRQTNSELTMSGSYAGEPMSGSFPAAQSLLLPYQDIPERRRSLLLPPGMLDGSMGGVGEAGSLSAVHMPGAEAASPLMLPNSPRMPSNVVRLTDLDMKVPVGEGASASVFVAIHLPTGRRLAVKRVDLSPLCLNDRVNSRSNFLSFSTGNGRALQLQHIVVRELQVLHLTYRSPFMVKVYNAFYIAEKTALDIVMEFMHYGSLDGVAKSLEQHAKERLERALARKQRPGTGASSSTTESATPTSVRLLGSAGGAAPAASVAGAAPSGLEAVRHTVSTSPSSVQSPLSFVNTSDFPYYVNLSGTGGGQTNTDITSQKNASVGSNAGADEDGSAGQDPDEELVGVAERVVAVVGEQLLRGVRDMHARGYIHRDIKPGNVLINEHGVVKLSDFGLSQRCDETGTGIRNPQLSVGAPPSIMPTRASTPVHSPCVSGAVDAAQALSSGAGGRWSGSNNRPTSAALFPSAGRASLPGGGRAAAAISSPTPLNDFNFLSPSSTYGEGYPTGERLASSASAATLTESGTGADGLDVLDAHGSSSSSSSSASTSAGTQDKPGHRHRQHQHHRSDKTGAEPARSSSSSSSSNSTSARASVHSRSSSSSSDDVRCSGTDKYMSPERQRGQPHGKPSDVWAVGVTLAEFALGRYPYDIAVGADDFERAAVMAQPVDVLSDEEERQQTAGSSVVLANDSATDPASGAALRVVAATSSSGGGSITSPHGQLPARRRVVPLSTVFADFVRLATLPVASERPTAQELLEHPFFKQWTTPFNLKAYLAARVPVPSNAYKEEYEKRKRERVAQQRQQQRCAVEELQRQQHAANDSTAAAMPGEAVDAATPTPLGATLLKAVGPAEDLMDVQ